MKELQMPLPNGLGDLPGAPCGSVDPLRQVPQDALLELVRSGAEHLASQPVAEAEFHAAFAEMVAGALRAVRKAEDKELRDAWMKEWGFRVAMSFGHPHGEVFNVWDRWGGPSNIWRCSLTAPGASCFQGSLVDGASALAPLSVAG